VNVHDIESKPTGPASSGATEVLGSEQTVEIKPDQLKSLPKKATLKVLLPTGDVFDREIPPSEVQLGKGPRNDIVITDPAVSTAHAAVRFDGRAYSVSDLGSRNGTYVNGERITGGRELHHGDVIGMGLSKLTFRLSGYSETGAIGLADVGVITNVVAPPLNEASLANAVVSEGLVSEADVEKLKGGVRRLARALVEERLISEIALCDLFSRTFQLPRVDLASVHVDEETVATFSSRLARDHHVFAFGTQAGVLLLAMADPTDQVAIERLEQESKKTVSIHVATFGQVAEQIEKYYGPKLIGVLPSGEKLRFLINQPEIEIGKASHNTVVLSDPTVSNTHAVIMVRDGGYSIVDLGSRNGTFVSGERLGTSARTLRHGDTIQLGQTVLTFRNSGETPENVTATLSPAALDELRRRVTALADADAEPIPDSAASTATSPEAQPVEAQVADDESGSETDDKKKKKKKKKTKDERLKAAYISGLSRIVAQVLGVVLAVLLALYVNSSMRSGSDKPVVETNSKGKAKVKLAKPGAGFEFDGGVFEASGVVQVPGTDGVYFVDDSKPSEILYMPVDDSGRQAGEIKPIDFGAAVADPEGIAYGGSFFYVVGSQSHKESAERNALARFAFDPATQTVQGHPDLITDLRGFLLANVPELGPYADTKGNEGGLNIEGIAWDPTGDRFLLGLRAPVIDGNALVIPLKMKDPRGAFSADNLSVGAVAKLSLGGQGIRDIQYDPRANAFLVIAGAPVHGESKNFALYEWAGEADSSAEGSAPRELSTLESKMKPEGITRVKSGSREFLFLVGDGSRYMKLDFATE
jgi:pSer/pThr/pTyr-binding forkhead associated (FHA) protein